MVTNVTSSESKDNENAFSVLCVIVWQFMETKAAKDKERWEVTWTYRWVLSWHSFVFYFIQIRSLWIELTAERGLTRTFLILFYHRKANMQLRWHVFVCCKYHCQCVKHTDEVAVCLRSCTDRARLQCKPEARLANVSIDLFIMLCPL